MVMGYNKTARIDLSTKEVLIEEVEGEFAHKYVGGRGWTAAIIFKEVPTGVKPLDPENKLVVATGPLTATGFPGAARTTFAAISPQTNLYGDSNVGGYLGCRLRFAGLDALIVEGNSPTPVYISIDNNNVKVMDAQGLWGRGALAVWNSLTHKHGRNASIAAIGVAGENLVSYACINIERSRQAGRTGMGAVMGNKRLKAFVVKGDGNVPVAQPKRLKKVRDGALKHVLNHPLHDLWKRQGTMSVVAWCQENEALPVRNFLRSRSKYADKIGGDYMEERTRVMNTGCAQCTILCEQVNRIKHPEFGIFEVGGPEYETTALMGSNLDLRSLEEVAYANYLCDDLGIDTISAGNVIGFIMECFERDMISKGELSFEPRFGDAGSVYKLLDMIAHRRGMGDLMARGVKSVSEAIGKGSDAIAMHVKGLEISGYDHRAAPAMALSYATADIGAHHNRSWAITYDLKVGRYDYGEDKVDRVIYLQHLRPLFDMLGVCRFHWVELDLDPELYAQAYSAVTGREHTLNDLLRKSEEIWNLTRTIGILRENISSSDDMLPKRVFSDGVPQGRTKGARLDRAKFEEMLQTYYYKRGWDAEGRPKKEKLLELGLEEAARSLYG